MGSSHKLKDDAKHEAKKALEFAKQEAKNFFVKATEMAKARLEDIKVTVKKIIYDVPREFPTDAEENVRDEIERICRENLEAIRDIESEAIGTVGNILRCFQEQAETICKNAVVFVGHSLVETFRELLCGVREASEESIHTIHLVASDVSEEIVTISEEAKKKSARGAKKKK